MQRSIYECDHCKKEIGKIPHVTMAIGSNGHASGIAFPPGTLFAKGMVLSERWLTRGFPANFMHLHVKCATPFFEALVKKEVAPPAARRGAKKR